jgi:hypothetical protein
MFIYTVYKTTNLINGKYYIGKHKTKNANDDYLGSGKYLKHAIKRYGKENFTKEILYVFSDEQQMNLTERILVVPDIEVNYNLCAGGNGGFEYINKNGMNGSALGVLSGGSVLGGKWHKGKPKTENHKNKIKHSLTGRTRSKEERIAISNEKKGKQLLHLKQKIQCNNCLRLFYPGPLGKHKLKCI